MQGNLAANSEKANAVSGPGSARRQLTIDHATVVQERIQRDRLFALAMFSGVNQAIEEGEPDVASLLLKDLIHGTVGINYIARSLNRTPRTVQRLLAGYGNQNINQFSVMLHEVQQHLNAKPESSVTRRAKSAARP